MSGASALPSGYALNEYRIESTLGVGGFGLTYLATDVNLNLRVALKEYLPAGFAVRDEDQSVRPKSEDAQETFAWGLRRFLDESRALASFRHPNIVRVMRYFQANQTAYMVMEFVEGESLTTWIRPRRPLSEAMLLDLALPLLDGLALIHRGNYLHRDIKPLNVFIRDDGSPVLLDFGSARVLGVNTDMTAVVTPGYAPFEQYHAHGNQGPWSDVYAFGALLYWIVVGKAPVEAAARVKKDVLTPAQEAGDRARYSEGLLRAIDWALKPDEEARPQSVAELISALPKAGGGDVFERATEIVPESPAPAPDGASAPSAPAPTTESRLATTLAFESETLQKVVAELAPHVGPIANVLVKKAARQSGTMAQLAERVSSEIADEKLRAAFVRKVLAWGQTSPVGAPTEKASGRTAAVASGRPAAPPGSAEAQSALAGATRSADSQTLIQRFEPAVLARAESDLARYIGAVARIVVRRAAAKARDETEFYLLLADQIEDKDERKAYIRRAISVSGGGA